MQTRTYVVLMPEQTPNTPLDILVETDPGSQDAPVVAGTDGAYYEILGRAVRVPNPASGAASFVPRLRLGYSVTITPYGVTPLIIPGVRLSESLVGDISSTDAGPTISVAVFADPAGGPAIRLVGANESAGQVYIVTLHITEPHDTDRSGTGA